MLLTTVNVLGRLLQHVVAVPARYGNERNSLGIVTNFLDKCACLFDNFVETVLAPLHGIMRMVLVQ